MNTLYPTYEYKLFKQGYNFIAGADEVGRGSLAGPLVACALVLSKPNINKIMKQSSYPVRDSKTLSKKQRENIIPLIEKHATSIIVRSIGNKAIDSKGMGWASKEIFYRLFSEIENEKCKLLIDAIKLPKLTLDHESIIKGDSKVFSIALASIYAKVYRDRSMYRYDKKYPLYGFNSHVGYGTPMHQGAIRNHGFCPIHRKTFCLNISPCK